MTEANVVSSQKRKICVVTGTRADYGPLLGLIGELYSDGAIDLKLLVTGMHLSPEFGLTVKEIEKDGFPIAEKVEILLSSDSAVATAKSAGLGLIGFADAFYRLKPDLVVLLGDRFEILSAAIAAHIARIPIAHISGGEVTEAVIDEAFRHSITKMAQLHFVAAEPYRQRVIQLGENPERVFLVGEPGLDYIENVVFLKRDELSQNLGLKLGSPLFLVTYHPVTLKGSPEKAFTELLKALDRFPESTIVFTRPNADTEGRILFKMLSDFAEKHPGQTGVFSSLGQKRYLSLMKIADVVIGNSSSGLIEAPALGVPTVNIGDRQKGRLRADSVIDCREECEKILQAICVALTPGFREKSEKCVNPYGKPGASKKIAKIIKEVPLENLIQKKFFDLF